MTKKEMEELSDLIVDKLVSKQKELDAEFIKDLEASNAQVEVNGRLSPRDQIVMEITRLIVMLDAFEKQENYEEAQVCSDRIAYLKNELTKL